MKKAEALIDKLIQEQALPHSYKDLVGDYLWPLVQDMAAISHNRKTTSRDSVDPWLVGLQGTQGSGKSTVCLFIKTLLETCFGFNVVVLSIDDFYKTHQQRLKLSIDTHPLLSTRGVPGTHDIDLIFETLHTLSHLKNNESCKVPSFNKAIDDRCIKSEWPTVNGKIDIILFEGWCMGIPAQSKSSIDHPINELEKQEDSNGRWRTFVNDQLSNEYKSLFDKLENLIVLKAPSFKCVYKWRLLQEEKLKQQYESLNDENIRIQDADQIKRFISHYERLTRYGLSVLDEEASWVLSLDEAHNMKSLYRNNNLVRLS